MLDNEGVYRSSSFDRLHKQSLEGLIPPIPDGDISADMYEETVSIAKSFGYTHYEVSNYARTQSAISRHNFSYWQGMDYLGEYAMILF